MKIKFYLFSFLILTGLMSCQKEEAFAPEEDAKSSQGLLTKSSGNTYVKLQNGNESFYVYDRNVGVNVPKGGIALNYTNDVNHPDNNNLEFKGDYYSWNEAKTVCPEGWRRPTGKELGIVSSAMKFANGTAYLDDSNGKKCYFPLVGHRTGSNNIRGYYWSSTPSNNERFRALNVGTDTSSMANSLPTLGLSVRCVKTVVDSDTTVLETIYGPFTGEVRDTPKVMTRAFDMSKSFELSCDITWKSIVWADGIGVLLHSNISDDIDHNIEISYRGYPEVNDIYIRVRSRISDDVFIDYTHKKVLEGASLNDKFSFIINYNALTKKLLISINGISTENQNIDFSTKITALMLGGHPRWSNGSCNAFVENLVIKN